MADLLRDCINRACVTSLGERISVVWPEFDSDSFVRVLVRYFKSAPGLNERLDRVTEELSNFLPLDFVEAARILVQSLGPELDDQADDPVSKEYSSSRGFIVVALGNFIARNGQDHFEVSMQALYEMTKRFSAEFDIRTFLQKYPEKTLTFFHQCV